MSLITRFRRWRLAKTSFWLPSEQQVNRCLLADSRFAAIHDVLVDQIASLFIAYRSWNRTESVATFSYRCDRFYEVSDAFTLCRIEAANAQGAIRFGGGMLAEIRLTTSHPVIDPAAFRLEELHLADVFIPPVTEPLVANGWIAELEKDGLLSRYGVPASASSPSVGQVPQAEYAELFAGCENASINLNSEQFHFLSPRDVVIGANHQDDALLPILDLREFGGLAITRLPTGASEVSFVSDGKKLWSEPTLLRAIRRVHDELGQQSDNSDSSH
jgi:hypothetical protein